MSLKITPINVAQDKKRIFLGIEADFFKYVAFSVMSSLGLFMTIDEMSFWAHLTVSLIPSISVIGFVLLFLNGKPPCYLKDFMAQHVYYLTKFNTEPLKGWSNPYENT